jgi:transglutaminase-like putative cysteine protease
VALPASAGDEAPAWLRGALSTPAPPDREPPAQILLLERNVTIDDAGNVTTTERRAVRVLTHNGKRLAFAAVAYDAESARIRDLQAWVVTPGGSVRRIGKEGTADVAAAAGDLYTETRVRTISPAGDVEAGSVFASEWTVTDRSVFTQIDFAFQDRLPTAASRLVLEVPAGWQVKALAVNHAPIPATRLEGRTAWELRDLAAIPDEPSSPSLSSLAPRLLVTPLPPGPRRTVTFGSWADVSQWLTSLAEPQAVVDPAIAAKARDLAGATTSEWDRIAAIGSFVQKLKYVSLQMGLGRGGGYTPHRAGEVLEKGYGDCKDKSNLMRTLLRAAGIPAYLVTLHRNDSAYVREEWPSPQQFDHCIVAVRPAGNLPAASGVDHPRLGRLVFFDPTQEGPALGELPDEERGGLALVLAGPAGELVRLPAGADASVERRLDFAIAVDGALTGSLLETSAGSLAEADREELRSIPESGYTRAVERWIEGGATGLRATAVRTEPRTPDGHFVLRVDLRAERYGQPLPGGLLLVRPPRLRIPGAPSPAQPTRTLPIRLRAGTFREKLRIAIPPGFRPDDLPDAESLEAAFGDFTATTAAEADAVVLTRHLRLKDALLPPSDYAGLRKFFDRIRAARDAPVVLKQK